jgi:tRNA nucleotidyltransferase/poly(A) polymerase
MGEVRTMTISQLINIGVSLLLRIEALGDFQAYIVGGTPRDLIIPQISNDVDISTNCPMEVLEENFRTFNIGKSRNFGILSVLYEGETFDVAQFRSDGDYSDGRRPDSITIVQDFKEDAARRDFTINSLAMDSRGGTIDYFSGIPDIRQRIIRAVGDPTERFKEDHLRMMRAARFASMDGFTIENRTRRAIRKLFRLISKVTPERIHGELVKAASKSGPQFAKYILVLDDLKLLYQILPEVHAMKYFRHDLQHHPEGPTVFDHSIECLRTMNDEPYQSKLAALLHDIGKCICFQEDKYWWKMTYHGHEKCSEPLVEGICNRLKFSSLDKEAMMFAAKNHMKFHEILKMKPSKIARLVSHTDFDTLLDVAKADEFSRGEKFMYRGEFDKVIKKVLEIRDRWESRVINSYLNLVDGNRIMKLTGLKPGPNVGIIKRSVENRIMDEQLDPADEKLVGKIILEESKKRIS